MTNATGSELTKRERMRERQRAAEVMRERRVQAHLARGKAAKEAARHARAEAEASGASPAEIAVVTHAASQRVIQTPLDEFLIT
ncbi:MAG TPA: hypothetical protein VIC57_16710 [Candidatus Dormibacteraeota bacterium]|jgi:hypothetical protein